MKKICIQNLELLITKSCNLNCAHCMRGKQESLSISDEIIEKTLQQVKGIGILTIGGGEPLLEIKKIETIFNYIIENRILIEEYVIITNGTIYSKDLIELFDYMEEYYIDDRIHGSIYISGDKYHISELQRLNLLKQVLENIEKYKECKYFMGVKDIHGELFREGNALLLPQELTIPFRPMKTYMSYPNNSLKLDIENGLCNIGPLITVNPEGILTEDVSWDSQNKEYNYGNILENSIEDICKRRKCKIIKPNKWYNCTGGEIEKFYNYRH